MIIATVCVSVIPLKPIPLILNRAKRLPPVRFHSEPTKKNEDLIDFR